MGEVLFAHSQVFLIVLWPRVSCLVRNMKYSIFSSTYSWYLLGGIFNTKVNIGADNSKVMSFHFSNINNLSKTFPIKDLESLWKKKTQNLINFISNLYYSSCSLFSHLFSLFFDKKKTKMLKDINLRLCRDFFLFFQQLLQSLSSPMEFNH